MAGGRPTTYTPELAELICQRVATTAGGIDKICDMYPDMPVPSTIILWRNTHDEFSTKYLRAKSLQAQMLVEQIDDMVPEKLKYYTDNNGDERIDAPSASLLIAKINNRKWTAARLAPRIYGNQLTDEQVSSAGESVAKLKSIVDGLNKTNSSDV